MADYAIAVILGLSFLCWLLLELSQKLTIENKKVWLVNLNMGIKYVMLFCSWLLTLPILSFMHDIIVTEQPALTGIQRIIETLIQGHIFFSIALFIFTFILLMNAMVENVNIDKIMKQIEKEAKDSD